MIKIVTVIGARPQFIKASAISRALRSEPYKSGITEIIVHTGQHYDDNMSAVFFDELDIPFPKYNLNVGSDNHGKQTAVMLEKLEIILMDEKPDAVVIYGDTNSTLAAALAASKIHIPVIHIEAGLRSFHKKMPEEINRICSDHVATLLFSPSKKGMENLVSEGFDLKNKPPYHIDNPGVFHCGDIMYDNALFFSKIANQKSNILQSLNLTPENYLLVTLHRDTNTDNNERLGAIFAALNEISVSNDLKIVIPLHPRTKKNLEKLQNQVLKESLAKNANILLIAPVAYLDFINLEKNTKLIITDSGGVQKEAFFFEKKCLILRDQTEWVELVELGMAELCGANQAFIVSGFEKLMNKSNLQFPQIYGNGNAAEFILDKIIETFS
jgi:UDP-GlcNAc3NAcA epimerase